MSEILPFVSCLEPVQVKTSKGLQLVPCGHCVACENKRRSELRAMVANEELKAKHSFFITLTFDDEHLPLFYWKDQCDFCPDDYLVRDDASVRDALFQGNMSSISKALSELDSYQIVRDCALFSNQSRIYTDKYFTKNRVRDFDTGELGIPFKNYGDVSRELRDYHIQLHKNLLRCKKLGFKTTGYTWLSYADSHGLDSSFCVPLLYYRDIQNFMKRLNKYIYGKIGKYKTFRYFIIGEYGTKSFRPHWHIILFTDSDEVATLMYDGYRKVIPLQENETCIPTAFYLRVGSSVIVLLIKQTAKLVDIFQIMLLALIVCQEYLKGLLRKKPFTLRSLALRTPRAKASNDFVQEILTAFPHTDTSMKLTEMLLNLVPFGGRITLNSSLNLSELTTCLVLKFIEYLKYIPNSQVSSTRTA